MPKQESKYANIPEADVVINYIKSRFQKGLGTNIFIIGLSGTGKSSSSIRVGELTSLDRKEENLRIFITDSILKLIDAVRQSKEGDIIVIEEVSVLFPSRRAMAGDNVAIGQIFDTIRKKRLCLISNAPIWTSIDTHMKAMGHLLIETLKIVKSEGVVVSKFHRLQTNPRSGKVYTHKMQRKGRDITLMITRKPNSDIWNSYEHEKDEFMEELYEKLKYQQVKKKEKYDKERGKAVKPKIRDLTKRELEVHHLYNVKGLNLTEIAKEKGISFQRVSIILKNIEKKSQIPKELSKFNVEVIQKPLLGNIT